MGQRVLITGGAGFIGSHIAERLTDDGYVVAVLDNLASGKRHQVPETAEFFELDVTKDIHSAFASFRPDAVVHQAAQVSVSYSIKEPQFDAQTNILGSLNVIECCREFGVKKIVYASSAASYGAIAELPLREDMRPHPVSFYGMSKYTVEHCLRTAKTEWGIDWAALRYANVYGPRQDPHGEAGVVAIFSNLLIDGKQPTIFGGGELTRDYVYVEDVAAANAIALSMDLSSHPDPVFNVSTGVPTSTNRVFELVQQRIDPEIQPIMGPDRPGDVQHSLLDNSKFCTLTNWKPKTSIEDGFERTADFFVNRERSV
ncbi:MAG: NAD-dependent epimerase/dehydratase family protein [Planctomycetota bacterium]